MPDAPARLIVLGMDAADPVLVRRWVREGRLPALAALMARGVHGDIASPEGFFVGSTWPSFFTACSPARHGFHYPVQLRPGTYRFDPSAEEGLGREPFWRALSRAGRRSAVLDVPLAALDPSINGVHVVEWGAHDALFGFGSWPRSLGPELRRRFGSHPQGSRCDAVRRTAADYQVLRDALVRGAAVRGALTRHVLARGGWDLLMQVFSETHCIGHQSWHLHDPDHPGHDAAIAAAIGDPLLAVYAGVDRAIGEIVAAAGDATIVVFAAHGMSYWYGAHFLLREILVRLGVTRLRASTHAPSASGQVLRAAWRSLPHALRAGLDPLRRWAGRDTAARADPHGNVDPASSLCFPVGNGLAVSGVRLNRVGREPRGILRPGAETARFIDALATDLRDIIDERTGRPLIRRVVRTADLYAGERLDRLPDLLVEWSDDMATGSTSVGRGMGATVRARSAKIGLVSGANDYGRTGEHRPRGFFVAAGPGIGTGRLPGEVSVMDLAPTFAARLGVELPACDGRVIAALARPAE